MYDTMQWARTSNQITDIEAYFDDASESIEHMINYDCDPRIDRSEYDETLEEHHLFSKEHEWNPDFAYDTSEFTPTSDHVTDFELLFDDHYDSIEYLIDIDFEPNEIDHMAWLSDDEDLEISPLDYTEEPDRNIGQALESLGDFEMDAWDGQTTIVELLGFQNDGEPSDFDYEPSEQYSRHESAPLETITKEEPRITREDVITQVTAEAQAFLRGEREDYIGSAAITTIDKFNSQNPSERITYEEFNLPDIFQYEANIGELTSGQFGKCILYMDWRRQTIGFTISETGLPIRTSTDDQKQLSDLFQHDKFTRIVGFHKNIPKPDRSRIMGGAAYAVLEDGSMFIDYRSLDFGEAHLDLIQRCIPNVAITTTQDQAYFNKTPVNKHILHYI